MTLQETIARAMFASDTPAPLLTHAQYDHYAQAVLDAIAEAGPTDEMIAAGAEALELSIDYSSEGQAKAVIKAALKAMIQAGKA